VRKGEVRDDGVEIGDMRVRVRKGVVRGQEKKSADKSCRERSTRFAQKGEEEAISERVSGENEETRGREREGETDLAATAKRMQAQRAEGPMGS
jgi:hypothetical protein